VDPNEKAQDVFDMKIKYSQNIFALHFPAEAYFIMVMASEFSTKNLMQIHFDLDM